MTTFSFPKAIVKLAVFAAIVAAAPFVLSSDANGAGQYNTVSSYKFCNGLPNPFPASIIGGDADLNGGGAGCANPSPIANDTAYDVTAFYDVPSGHYNFGSGVVGMTNSAGFVAADAAIPDGQKVGGLESQTTLGLLNGPCTTPLIVDFIFYESTTNTANTIAPAAEGTPDRFANLKTDANGDNFADSTSPFVSQYPTFYNPGFDPDLQFPGGPDGAKPPIAPRARYTGMTRVPPATGDWIILSFFQLTSGQLADFDTDPNNKFSQLARLARQGVPAGTIGHDSYNLSFSILQDPTAVQASPSPITDFCSPLGVRTMLKGMTPGGQTRGKTGLVNSGVNGGNTHLYVNYSFSLRDADDDGLENAVDTCPYNANSGADGDSDGIDNACDPPGGANTDEDGDGFDNRQDNCPKIANPTQVEGEQTTTHVLAAPDGGPKTDGIGDACDSEGGGSDTVANGTFILDLDSQPNCIGAAQTDADADGWCAGAGGCAAGNDPNDANAAQSCSSGSEDIDGDGVSDKIEIRAQTDPMEDCPKGNKQHAWGPDNNNSGKVDIVDVGAYRPAFNKSEGQAGYSKRLELAASLTKIDIVDVGALRPFFNKTCPLPGQA